MNNLTDEFIKYIRDELTYSARTVEAYASDLSQWRDHAVGDGGSPDDFDPMSVTASDLRVWVGSMARRGLSPFSIRRKMSAVKSFMRFLMRQHGLKADPTVGVTLPRTPKQLPVFVQPSETEAILGAPVPDDSFTEVRDRLILDIFYTCGLRCSELMGLCDADVDTAKGELKVHGKRNKDRVVPFGTELARAIDDYRALRDADPARAVGSRDLTAPLLVKADGEPLYRKLLYNVVHRQLSEGGAHAARLSPHVMRHSCATDMLNSGAPLASVQQMMGHASLTSTQVYTHVTYKDLKNNYQLAHPRASKKGGTYGN